MFDLHRAPRLWLLIPATILAASSVGLGVFSDVYVPVVDRLFPEATPHAPGAVPPLARPLSDVDVVERAGGGAADRRRWQPATVVYKRWRRYIDTGD